MVEFNFVDKKEGDPPFELNENLFLAELDNKRSKFNQLLKGIVN